MLLKTIYLPQKTYKNIVFGYNNLVALLEAKTIAIYDVSDEKQIKKIIPEFEYFSNIVFSHDGKYVLVADSLKHIKLFELTSFREVLSFETEEIFDIAIDSSSELIAFSNYNNHKIKLWDVKSNREIFSFEGYQHSKSSISFSPNTKILAFGDYNSGYVGLLNVKTQKLIHLLSGIHSNGDLVFSTDGRWIAGESYYRDAAVLFDIKSGNQFRILEDKKKFHNSEITCIAFSSNSRLVASGSYDLTIRIWDIFTGKQVRVFRGHETTIFDVFFTNNDQILISASADCTIRFWQI